MIKRNFWRRVNQVLDRAIPPCIHSLLDFLRGSMSPTDRDSMESGLGIYLPTLSRLKGMRPSAVCKLRLEGMERGERGSASTPWSADTKPLWEGRGST